MKSFGKKGFGAGQVASVIVVVVVIFFLVGPITSTTKIAQASSEVEQCRLSVISSSIELAYSVKVLNIELFKPTAPNPFYIDCKKSYAYINNERIKVDDVNQGLAGVDKRDQREKQLKDFVLGEMSKCWRSFGDASDKIYTASVGFEEEIDTETACFSCSEVIIDDEFAATTLEDFYSYANDKRRLTDQKSYVNFLTGGTDLEEVPEDKSITFEEDQQWSTIFTITRIDNHVWGESYWEKVPVFGSVAKFFSREIAGSKLPKPNSAIVGCYMAVVNEDGEDALVKYKGSPLGCDENVNGFILGKVAEGYDERSLSPLDTLTGAGLPVNRNAARFPMTVRFIPTEDVFRDGQCKRLY